MNPERGNKQILIVRPGALGDTILSIPLIDSIRRKSPGCTVTFLGNRSYRDLAPEGIEYLPMDHRDRLWMFSPEALEIPRETRVFDTAYLVLSRPDQVRANLKRAGTGTILHVSSRPPDRIHVVEHLHSGFKLPVPVRSPALKQLGAPERKPILWVHPGSGGPGKCIPLSVMAHLAQGLRAGLGWDLAVTAGEEDGFLKALPEWKGLIQGPCTQLLENRPLSELCETLGGAGLFMGNDSGISHLAAGMGIPSVVFFVSTDPLQWAPWVPEQQVLVIDVRQREITRCDFWNEVETLLHRT
jgi:heptosyltransferase-3